MAEIGIGAERDLANPQKFYVNVSAILRSIQHETRRPGSSPWTRLNDSVDEQYGLSSTSVDTHMDVFRLASQVFEDLVQRLARGEPVIDHEEILNSVLAICLRQALRAKSASCRVLMETLANASRLR